MWAKIIHALFMTICFISLCSAAIMNPVFHSSFNLRRPEIVPAGSYLGSVRENFPIAH